MDTNQQSYSDLSSFTYTRVYVFSSKKKMCEFIIHHSQDTE